MTLNAKIAVVTGAASGIGRAIALKFAGAGAHVFAADINETQLAETRKMAPQSQITIVPTNMADKSQVEGLIDSAAAATGGLDILVNAAGIMDSLHGVATMPDAIWSKNIAINLEGPMFAMRRAIPLMLRAGGGAIINIASMSAVSGAAAGAAYTAAKHGLMGLSQSTAWIYAKQGIRCNVIMPGATHTNIGASVTAPINEEDAVRLREFQALSPKWLEPVDIAELALFLASDLSRNINGAKIAADGGWSAT